MRRRKGKISATQRSILFVVTLACTMVVSSAASALPKGGASPFIRDLGARAIAILQSSELSVGEREDRFRKLLHNGFDMKLIGRFVLGRYYRQASAQERRDYMALFGDYVTRTYSARLGGYAGEQLVVVSETPLRNGKDVLVNTRLTRPGGVPIKATWRVRSGKRGLRIIDVIVEGMSMVVTQRDEFAAVIRRHGLGGLIQSLRARTAVAHASR